MLYAEVLCAEKPALFECLDAGNVVASTGSPGSPGSRIAALITDFPFMHRMRKRGDYLFHVGDSFHFIYVLNAGFAKTCCASADGQEQTMGLHLRGDILGFDAISSGSHGSDAVALDTCDVLALPYDVLLEHSQRSPALTRELLQAFSAEIHAGHELMGNMRGLSAAGRVAAFLLAMSVRFAARGFSATEIQLRLTRHEIGSILGLELETVSRVFSRFAQLGLISVCLREIVLLDRDRLQDMIARPVTVRRSRAAQLTGVGIVAPVARALAQLAAGD